MDDQPGNVAGRIGFLDKTKFDDVHDASGKPTEVEPPEGSHVEDDCLKLSALGRSRFIQFRDTESLSDLEESIGFFTRALASTPNGHPDISHRHAELGVSYGDRYRRLGMLTDLEKAIEYHTRALRLTPDSHPDLSRRHANLGMSYGDRYQRLGMLEDLEKAIEYHTHALRLTPNRHPDISHRHAELGVSYGDRYRRLGELTDLEKAIEYHTRALVLTPNSHPDLSRRHANLGVSYGDRYQRLGMLEDLEKAIEYHTHALRLTPNRHPDISHRHAELGVSYGDRYRRLGELTDLEKAIEYHTRALVLTPNSHPDLSRRHANLGVSYGDRYKRLGELADLEKAIEYHSLALRLTPNGHPDISHRHAELGVSYGDRYQRLGMLEDLEKAIEYHTRALRLTPDSHPDLSRRHANLATTWDQYVFSEAFNRDCNAQSKRLASSSSGFESYEQFNLWDSDDASWVDSSSHGVSKFEAYLYYYGLRGNRKPGPKLIYRTSTDIFLPPSGPSQDLRKIQLLAVHEHAKLGRKNLWATIRDKTVGILDRKQIKYTSVDLVRFRREEQTEDGRDKTVTNPVTIWVGVRPDSTNGDAAFDSAQDVIELLKRYDIDDIDIAYRESETQPLAGPILYAPVNNVHPLKSVIDWVTTALSLPIAGLRTHHIQGTLGFYFKIDEDLYGVTARHVLFPDTEGNDAYSYATSAPKKNVVLMGNKAFDDLLESIKAFIGTLNNTVTVLEKSVKSRAARAERGDQQAAADLVKFQQNLDDTKATIAELRKFFATLKKDWSEVNKRIIGHVVWSPPITGLTAPHGYTRDVCVIKLDKEKFLPNLRGNAIDLGTEIESGKFMSLLYPRYDAPSEFDYPEDRIYLLKVILAAAKIKEPNSQDIKGDPTRFVFKRGLTTRTTVGRLNGFESCTRRYGPLGHFDSVEAAVYPYDNDSDPFSRAGDSGAAIVGANNDFVAQLTSGTGLTNSSDITYGTPMEWLWHDVIKAKFPNAVLFFDVPASN
ncbi:unnamed protein product [Rhizoctonia solani]|uniref:Uncharacterized protein n=1 Tax=Rhizoctonia solani TaxID=456999 RepID=A0A8H3DVF0_9AGAM|nr:unnamed protein product [Rhizoctonia solani]